MPTLIVEDGSVVTGANTYVSVADVDTYLADYGKTSDAWDSATADGKASAVLRASQIMRARYGGQWRGEKTEKTQPMQWPRKDVRDYDGDEYSNVVVPPEVRQCQMEISLLVIAGEAVINDKVAKPPQIKRETVGPITTEFFEAAPGVDLFPWIDQLVSEFATVGANKMGLSIGLTDHERNQGDSEFDPFDYPEYFHLTKGY